MTFWSIFYAEQNRISIYSIFVEIPEKMTAKVCEFSSMTATNSARPRDVMELFSKSARFLFRTLALPLPGKKTKSMRMKTWSRARRNHEMARIKRRKGEGNTALLVCLGKGRARIVVSAQMSTCTSFPTTRLCRNCGQTLCEDTEKTSLQPHRLIFARGTLSQRATLDVQTSWLQKIAHKERTFLGRES